MCGKATSFELRTRVVITDVRIDQVRTEVQAIMKHTFIKLRYRRLKLITRFLLFGIRTGTLDGTTPSFLKSNVTTLVILNMIVFHCIIMN